MTRCNFIKTHASKFYNCRDLNSFPSERFVYGLSQEQKGNEITEYAAIESVIRLGSARHPEFETKLAEFSVSSVEVTKYSHPYVVERLQRQLSKSLVKMPSRFEQLGGHICLYTWTGQSDPICIKSQATRNSEVYIESKMMAYGSLFVQEVERVSKLNNCCYNGSGYFATAFCQMNSNKKKEVIHRLLLKLFTEAVSKPNIKRINRRDAETIGWPTYPILIITKISKMTVEELDTMKALLDNKAIKMAPK
jgi:hypothetical protein